MLTHCKEVANIMKDQEKPPTRSSTAAAKTMAALMGVHLGGFGGLVEGTIGESAAEAVARRVSDKLFADALAEPSAASRLPEALRTGNTTPVVSALVKADPTWFARAKSFVGDLVQKYKSSKFGSETGAVGADVKQRRTGSALPGPDFEEQLKSSGMSDEDIEELRGYRSAPTEGETENNASGGNATSLEAVRRLAGQRGEQHFRVDSRMANSPDAWKPIPANVDRV